MENKRLSKFVSQCAGDSVERIHTSGEQLPPQRGEYAAPTNRIHVSSGRTITGVGHQNLRPIISAKLVSVQLELHPHLHFFSPSPATRMPTTRARNKLATIPPAATKPVSLKRKNIARSPSPALTDVISNTEVTHNKKARTNGPRPLSPTVTEMQIAAEQRPKANGAPPKSQRGHTAVPARDAPLPGRAARNVNPGFLSGQTTVQSAAAKKKLAAEKKAAAAAKKKEDQRIAAQAAEDKRALAVLRAQQRASEKHDYDHPIDHVDDMMDVGDDVGDISAAMEEIILSESDGNLDSDEAEELEEDPKPRKKVRT